jgi:hypothetical protein
MTKLSPKYFILPLLALVVIGSLPAPADTGTATRNRACGPAVAHMSDATMRATFESFDRTQSAAAAKVCAIFNNSATVIASR